MTDAPSGIVGAVLAAGESRRMGRPKPFLPYGESTFLRTILDRMREAGIARRLIIANPNHAHLYEAESWSGHSIHFNPKVEWGQLESMKLAVRNAPDNCKWLMMTPVDIPAISVRSYKIVARACMAASRPVIHIGSCNDRWGHPMVLPQRLFGEFLAWDGPMGARGFLEAKDRSVVLVETGDEAVLHDADTPEDYERLMRNFPTPCLPPENDLT